MDALEMGLMFIVAILVGGVGLMVHSRFVAPRVHIEEEEGLRDIGRQGSVSSMSVASLCDPMRRDVKGSATITYTTATMNNVLAALKCQAIETPQTFDFVPFCEEGEREGKEFLISQESLWELSESNSYVVDVVATQRGWCFKATLNGGERD